MSGDESDIRFVVVPQTTAGPREVRLISFAKSEGDSVALGDIICTFESDKAIWEVESPCSGTLIEWLAVENSVVRVGSPVARIMEPTLAKTDASGAPWATDSAGKITKSARGGKSKGGYTERGITESHRTFVMRIRRSQDLVVPSVIKRSMDWAAVCRIAEAHNLCGKVQPSPFQTFAFAVAQAASAHPKLRSTMPTDDMVREYDHVNLGIAVGLPNGHLNVAVVPEADTLGYDEFVTKLQRNIVAARMGKDQADDSVQLLLTYMGGYEIEDSIPLLVAPAVAVVFVGAPYDRDDVLRANLTMTFDHRLIQGVEAAVFLNAVAQKVGDAGTWPARHALSSGEI